MSLMDLTLLRRVLTEVLRDSMGLRSDKRNREGTEDKFKKGERLFCLLIEVYLICNCVEFDINFKHFMETKKLFYIFFIIFFGTKTT